MMYRSTILVSFVCVALIYAPLLHSADHEKKKPADDLGLILARLVIFTTTFKVFKKNIDFFSSTKKSERDMIEILCNHQDEKTGDTILMDFLERPNCEDRAQKIEWVLDKNPNLLLENKQGQTAWFIAQRKKRTDPNIMLRLERDTQKQTGLAHAVLLLKHLKSNESNTAQNIEQIIQKFDAKYQGPFPEPIAAIFKKLVVPLLESNDNESTTPVLECFARHGIEVSSGNVAQSNKKKLHAAGIQRCAELYIACNTSEDEVEYAQRIDAWKKYDPGLVDAAVAGDLENMRLSLESYVHPSSWQKAWLATKDNAAQQLLEKWAVTNSEHYNYAWDDAIFLKILCFDAVELNKPKSLTELAKRLKTVAPVSLSTLTNENNQTLLTHAQKYQPAMINPILQILE